MKQRTFRIIIIILSVMLALVSCALFLTVRALLSEHRAEDSSRSSGNTINSGMPHYPTLSAAVANAKSVSYGARLLPVSDAGKIPSAFLAITPDEKIKLKDSGAESATPFSANNMFPGDVEAKTYVVYVNDDTATVLSLSGDVTDKTVYSGQSDPRLARDMSLMTITVRAGADQDNLQTIYQGNFASFTDVNYTLDGEEAVYYSIGVALDKRAGNDFAGLSLSMNLTWSFEYENIVTVTYTDGIGGTAFSAQSYTVEKGTATPAFSGTPYRQHYQFDGWTPTVSPTATENVVYQAVWTRLYTVIYSDGVDGTAFADQSYTVTSGSSTPAFSGTPSRNGFIFLGWNPTVSETVTGNVMYTAMWQRQTTPSGSYTVTYVDGIDGLAFSPQKYTIVAGGLTPEFTGTPKREGYTFVGWAPTLAGIVTKSVTYTALWQPSDPNPPTPPTPTTPTSSTEPPVLLYIIKYSDGVGGTAFADQTYIVNIGDPTPEFSGIPSRSGYIFSGWNPDVSDTVTGSMVYTALWTGDGPTPPPPPPTQQYSVTYTDGIGGTAFADQKYTVESGEATPAFSGAPRREGYIFLGWSPAVSSTVTSDVTYTALWEEIPAKEIFTVRYRDGIDGTSFADQTYTAEQGSATPAFVGTPKRLGYTFVGWMPAISPTVTANVTYTAVWAESATVITIDEVRHSGLAIVEISDLHGGDVIINRITLEIKDSGYSKIYFGTEFGINAERLSDVLKFRIVCEDTGEVIYDGYLKDVSESIEIGLSGIADETLHYTAVFSLDEKYADEYSQYISQLALKWFVKEKDCHCLWCAVIRLFGDPYCVCPWCWIIPILLLLIAILTVLYLIGKRRNGKIKESLEERGADEKEIHDNTYRRWQYIHLGLKTVLTFFIRPLLNNAPENTHPTEPKEPPKIKNEFSAKAKAVWAKVKELWAKAAAFAAKALRKCAKVIAAVIKVTADYVKRGIKKLIDKMNNRNGRSE